MKVVGVVDTSRGRQVAVSNKGNIDGYIVEQRRKFCLVRLAVGHPGVGIKVRTVYTVDDGAAFDCEEHGVGGCWHMEAVRQWRDMKGTKEATIP